MLYIYLNSEGIKLATKTIQNIANLTHKDRATITRYLKTGYYNNKGIILLRFEENEINKAIRNSKGNPVYKLLPEIFRQSRGNSE
jgi:hypothetical protein